MFFNSLKNFLCLTSNPVRKDFGKRNDRRARRNVRSAQGIADVQLLEPRKLMTVTYHGGALIPHVEAQAMYLGTDWSTNSTLQTQAGKLERFLPVLVSGQYMDMLTNAGYSVGRGTASPGLIDNVSLSKTSGVTDASIRQDIQAMITTGHLKAPDANRLYVVYVEPDVVVYHGNASSMPSPTGFFGYHNAFAGQTAAGSSIDIHYAVIAYPGGRNGNPVSEGFASAFDIQTDVTSHEVTEAVTDPNVQYKTLGWYDDQLNGEIGDIANLKTVSFQGYLVQKEVNQQDQLIVPNSGVTTLNAPQNLHLTATSYTTADLTWNSVSGATGYRLYILNGNQMTLIATLSSSATMEHLTGMTAGYTYSFVLQAFNTSTSANSAVASITMPQTLTAPVVTIGLYNGGTEVELSWNGVSGAQGYRIYCWNGYNTVLLGTYSATTHDVWYSLNGGSYSFLVQAFNGNVVANSAWTAVV